MVKDIMEDKNMNDGEEEKPDVGSKKHKAEKSCQTDNVSLLQLSYTKLARDYGVRYFSLLTLAFLLANLGTSRAHFFTQKGLQEVTINSPK